MRTLTHFYCWHDREEVTLEVERAKWFATSDHPAIASCGVLEMSDGTLRHAWAHRPECGLRGYRYIVSAPVKDGETFWGLVNRLRDNDLDITFEMAVSK